MEGETTDPLNLLLQWETSAWVHDPKYLIDQVNRDKDPDDDDFTVLIERRRRPNSPQQQGEGAAQRKTDELFGFGVHVHNTHVPLVDFLRNFYCEDSACQGSEWLEYLNVQDLRDSNGSVWRPPLSLPALRKDIPTPTFLQQFLEDATLTDINLWMGNTFEGHLSLSLSLPCSFPLIRPPLSLSLSLSLFLDSSCLRQRDHQSPPHGCSR
jgi:hypothetical protein